jgi:hypothetical protein
MRGYRRKTEAYYSLESFLKWDLISFSVTPCIKGCMSKEVNQLTMNVTHSM